MFSLLGHFGRALLDFALPPHCLVCREPLAAASEYLCPQCWAPIRAVRPARCPRCSCPNAERGCANCAAWELERVLVLGDHAGPLREAIHRFKFEGQRQLGEPLGWCLGQAPEFAAALREVDLLIPVPLHAARQRERGYNQSEELARGLSGVLGAPLCTDHLRRRRATRQQASLDAAGRHENLAGAFEVCGVLPAHTCIGLVDDVVTTASTLSACAQALQQAGARRIWGLALACPFLKPPLGTRPFLDAS
ncbi:MAG: ComF family protein [Candidatus Latescibacteria bacterium]|nr:ComF family protein [Candidatus Latescibacterota bacterium]